MRTGNAGPGLGWLRRSRSRWPIHLTGRSSPDAVTTTSPAFSVSTGTSPRGVRMSVPATKQGVDARVLLVKEPPPMVETTTGTLGIATVAESSDAGLSPL